MSDSLANILTEVDLFVKVLVTILQPTIVLLLYWCTLLLNVNWDYKELMGIVYKHWPDTREFITQIVELWNRWIRLLSYNNQLQNTCPLYTHVTPILYCISPCNLFRSIWSMFSYNNAKYFTKIVPILKPYTLILSKWSWPLFKWGLIFDWPVHSEMY